LRHRGKIWEVMCFDVRPMTAPITDTPLSSSGN
jgi:hypothetical protein